MNAVNSLVDIQKELADATELEKRSLQILTNVEMYCGKIEELRNAGIPPEIIVKTISETPKYKNRDISAVERFVNQILNDISNRTCQQLLSAISETYQMRVTRKRNLFERRGIIVYQLNRLARGIGSRNIIANELRNRLLTRQYLRSIGYAYPQHGIDN